MELQSNRSTASSAECRRARASGTSGWWLVFGTSGWRLVFGRHSDLAVAGRQGQAHQAVLITVSDCGHTLLVVRLNVCTTYVQVTGQWD
jgi:hypothetical protein